MNLGPRLACIAWKRVMKPDQISLEIDVRYFDLPASEDSLRAAVAALQRKCAEHAFQP